MATKTTSTTDNSAGCSPCTPEAHQRADIEKIGFATLLHEIQKRLSDPGVETALAARGEGVVQATREINWAIEEYWKEIEFSGRSEFN